MSDGLLRWAINVGTLLFVSHTSHQQGYAQGQRDLVQQASLLEMERMKEEIERLKRERNGWR